MKRGIEPRDRTTAVCAGSLEKGFYSSYPLRLNHSGPGVFLTLQLLQPTGKGLFVAGQVQTLCCVPPVLQGLLMLAGDKTYLLFGGGPQKGNHPEQHQGSQRQGA